MSAPPRPTLTMFAVFVSWFTTLQRQGLHPVVCCAHCSTQQVKDYDYDVHEGICIGSWLPQERRRFEKVDSPKTSVIVGLHSPTACVS